MEDVGLNVPLVIVIDVSEPIPLFELAPEGIDNSSEGFMLSEPAC